VECKGLKKQQWASDETNYTLGVTYNSKFIHAVDDIAAENRKRNTF